MENGQKGRVVRDEGTGWGAITERCFERQTDRERMPDSGYVLVVRCSVSYGNREVRIMDRLEGQLAIENANNACITKISNIKLIK